jgi:hypothetical protein
VIVGRTQLGNVLLFLSAVPAVLSVLVFSRVTWYRSAWGRHMMSYMAVVALVLVLGCARVVWGDSIWFTAVRAAAYVATVAVLWWRLKILVQSLREGSPDESSTHKKR